MRGLLQLCDSPPDMSMCYHLNPGRARPSHSQTMPSHSLAIPPLTDDMRCHLEYRCSLLAPPSPGYPPPT